MNAFLVFGQPAAVEDKLVSGIVATFENQHLHTGLAGSIKNPVDIELAAQRCVKAGTKRGALIELSPWRGDC